MNSFPRGAHDFYRDLKEDNSREFWVANRDRYEAQVRGPLLEVAGLLEGEFGKAKLFRPNRDVRFSADKSPYKTHQGLFVAVAPACGFYLEVNAEDARALGGFYAAPSDRLAAIRADLAEETSGVALSRVVEQLGASGWLTVGDTVKTAPRGYSAQHPRIALLRHRTFAMECELTSRGVEEFACEVTLAWRHVTPLIDWFAARLRD